MFECDNGCHTQTSELNLFSEQLIHFVVDRYFITAMIIAYLMFFLPERFQFFFLICFTLDWRKTAYHKVQQTKLFFCQKMKTKTVFIYEENL